jgi:hypothetical protein
MESEGHALALAFDTADPEFVSGRRGRSLMGAPTRRAQTSSGDGPRRQRRDGSADRGGATAPRRQRGAQRNVDDRAVLRRRELRRWSRLRMTCRLPLAVASKLVCRFQCGRRSRVVMSWIEAEVSKRQVQVAVRQRAGRVDFGPVLSASCPNPEVASRRGPRTGREQTWLRSAILSASPKSRLSRCHGQCRSLSPPDGRRGLARLGA